MFLTQQLSRAYRYLVLVVLVLLTAHVAVAQEERRPSIFADVVKGVALDPTTYVPAILGYDATMKDWNTSQVFFRNGFVEHNANFTASGLPNDRPISYDAGREQILRDALANLQVSIANNVADRLFEHTLVNRYPEHRTLIKTLGWVERIGVATALSYKFAAVHYEQAALNRDRAAALGLR